MEFDPTQLHERVQRQLDEVNQVAERMATMRVTGESSDQLVKLVLGPGRTLLDVTIDTSAFRLASPSTLKASLLEAHQNASRRLDEALVQLTAQLPNADAMLSMINGELPASLRETVAGELKTMSGEEK